MHIWEWLQHPLDPARPHNIDPYIAWHARLMVLAWGVLLPLGILIARFFKITPKQHFPKQVENKMWWYSHLVLQILGSIIAVLALIYVLIYGNKRDVPVHETLGWATMIGLFIQVVLGLCRGSSGGPTHQQIWGHHYFMTGWRYFFEYTHKNLGYVVLILSWITGSVGMWHVNAPIWMWIVLGGWLCVLVMTCVYLQYRGYAVDTYESLWGVDRCHPGNTKRVINFGVRRLRLEYEGKVQKKKRHIDILGRYNPPPDTHEK